MDAQRGEWVYAIVPKRALIDGVYILNRGYIHLTQKRGVTENADGNAITQCYFSILNLSKEKLFVVDLRI
jgi:hypothetical protein